MPERGTGESRAKGDKQLPHSPVPSEIRCGVLTLAMGTSEEEEEVRTRTSIFTLHRDVER